MRTRSGTSPSTTTRCAPMSSICAAVSSIGSISDGSLFLTLPTRALTGHAAMSSAAIKGGRAVLVGGTTPPGQVARAYGFTAERSARDDTDTGRDRSDLAESDSTYG